MYRLIIVALLLIVVLPSSIQIRAQDKSKCDSGAVIKVANALKSTGDSKKDVDALLKLAADIDKLNVVCNGMQYKGDSPKIVGPLKLAAGTYKTIVTTSGLFFAKIIDDESCLVGFNPFLYSLTYGEARRGAESQFRLKDDCEISIQPTNVTAPWTLVILQQSSAQQ